MKRIVFAGTTLILVLVAIPLQAADLASAKALYASASYEEALTMLASLEGTESVEQVNQIRALCLLALGRSKDAEQAVEQIVVHNPTYQLENTEVSPKLVTLFHDVRRRALPAAARALYAKAKSSYDQRNWTDAQRDFAALLRITSDPDLGDRAALSDLQQLAEGFLKLSENEIEQARRAEEARAAEEAKRAAEAKRVQEASAAAQQPAPPSPGGGGSAPTPRPATAIPSVPVYTALDPTVKPPVELRRQMPRWTPANRAMATMTLSGLLEVVIDETGTVMSANMAKPVTPTYDQVLLQATRTWRFSPALKDGKPVRYRQVLEIVLRPATPQE
jgi:TonB family protein